MGLTFIKIHLAREKPRIRYQPLQLDKNRGGVALPSLKDYYTSAQLKVLSNKCNSDFGSKWKEIKKALFKDIPIQATIGDKNLLKKLYGVGNPWINLSVKIWRSTISQCNLGEGVRVLRWCTFDSEFTPDKLDITYKRWPSQGLSAYCTFLHQDLKKTHGIANTDF